MLYILRNDKGECHCIRSPLTTAARVVAKEEKQKKIEI